MRKHALATLLLAILPLTAYADYRYNPYTQKLDYYSNSVASATYSAVSATSTYSVNAGTATYSPNALNASYAVNAGTSVYSQNAGLLGGISPSVYFTTGVAQITAGTNITISPSDGKGIVTVNATAQPQYWIGTATSPLNMSAYRVYGADHYDTKYSTVAYKIAGNDVLRLRNTDTIVVGNNTFSGSGNNNCLIGNDAGKLATTGYANTAVGSPAMYTLRAGYYNSAVGLYALHSLRDGHRNSAFGFKALFKCDGGYSNVALGESSLSELTSGNSNMAIGAGAFGALTDGVAGVAIGVNALASARVGSHIGIGYGALGKITTAVNNVAIGYRSGNDNVIGGNNVFIGNNSGYTCLGGGNTFLGFNAGLISTNTNNCILIGQDADVTKAVNNSFGMGYKVQVTESNIGVFGTPYAGSNWTDVYFGAGVVKANPEGVTLQSTGGSGTNNYGAPLTIAGGKGTGTGAGGAIVLKTAGATSSGTTLNPLSSVMVITSTFTVEIGTSTQGRTVFEPDGTMRMENDATVWNDVFVELNPASAVYAPTYTDYKAGRVITFSDEAANPDRIHFVTQLPHGYKPGTTIEPHVHWTGEDGTAGQVAWKLDYSTCAINGTFGVTNSTTTYVVKSTTADYHEYTDIGTIAGVTGISTVIMGTLSRDSTAAGDTYNGKSVYLLQFDLHYQSDTIGSRTELTK